MAWSLKLVICLLLVAGAVTNPVVTNPAVTNPAVTNPTVTNPAVTNPAVTNPAVTNPAVTNPAVTNPAVTNPAVTNPAVTNPAVTDPAVTNPAVTNPAVTNPAVTDPAITNPAVTNPAVTNPAVTNPAVTNPAVTDPAVTNPAVTDPAVTNPAVTDPAVTNPAVTDPAVTNPPGTDPAVTDSSTKQPGGTDETTKPAITDPPKETETPKPITGCDLNPCKGGSTCEDRLTPSYVCLCLAGDNYDYTENQCVRAKVFPGELTYSGENFDKDMEDPTTASFNRVATTIVAELKTVYETDPTYIESIVTKLSEPAKRAGVVATVEIMFKEHSTITQSQVTTAIKVVGEFTVTSLCEADTCDKLSSTCKDTDGSFTCDCNDGFLATNFTDRLCVAACPNSQELVDGECKKCSFGYSGFDCKDNWQLILTIVGSILGGLLLITIILLPVVALISKKKLKKAKASSGGYEKPASKPAPGKTPQVSNGLAAPRPAPVKPTPNQGLSGFGANGVPRIPRATANDGWDRGTNLEMVPSNSRQNLIPSGRNARRFDDDDDDTGPYYSRPMKPQNNPYAIGRPQVNPYASNQGNSNPYYRH